MIRVKYFIFDSDLEAVSSFVDKALGQNCVRIVEDFDAGQLPLPSRIRRHNRGYPCFDQLYDDAQKDVDLIDLVVFGGCSYNWYGNKTPKHMHWAPKVAVLRTIISLYHRAEVPLFGICGGAQLLAAAALGKFVVDMSKHMSGNFPTVSARRWSVDTMATFDHSMGVTFGETDRDIVGTVVYPHEEYVAEFLSETRKVGGVQYHPEWSATPNPNAVKMLKFLVNGEPLNNA